MSADTGLDLTEKTPGVEDRLSLGPLDGHLSYDEVLSAADPAPLADQPRGADMLYSSGTTGRPKGIKPPLPKGQVHDTSEALIGLAQHVWGFGRDTAYLSPAPVYHAAPLRFGAATQALGGTVVLMERFDPEPALALIQEHHVTHSQWVPTIFVGC
jgi:fatty-acyl-CoA synthase